MSPKSRHNRWSQISRSRKSAAKTSGSAIEKRRSEEARRRSPAVWPLSRRNRLLRRSLRRLELLLRVLEQLLLGRKARAANRLAQLDPLDVVDFAELRLELAAGVRHQIEVDALADQCVAGAKKVLDCVERLHDFRLEARLLEHLAQGGRFRSLPRRNGAFGESPPRLATGGDQRNIRYALPY